MSTVAITYRRNPQYSEHTPHEPRLFATIDLSRYGVSTKITDLPIYFRQLDKPAGPVRVVYSAHVAGLPLESGNLEGLVAMLDSYIGALIRFERLPEYVFHVGTKAWPIYRLPGQLVTRYPGGPVFSAPSLPELRIWLADHFKQVGRIRNRKDLGILYLSPADLQLYPPDCALRSPGVADIPVFPTAPLSPSPLPPQPFDPAQGKLWGQRGAGGQGQQLLAPVGSRPITVPMNNGAEIFDLHRAVGEYLMQRGRLTNPYDMTVRKLAPSTWAQVQAALEAYPQALIYYREVEGRLCREQVPVFAHGGCLVAARTNRLGRTALYLGPDIRALQLCLGEELSRHGTVSSPDAVRPASVQQARSASRLDGLLHSNVLLSS